MDLVLSPELIALQEKVRAFINRDVIPLEVEVEMAEGQLDPAARKRLYARVKELELNAISLPVSVGGRGFSWVAQAVVNEELGKATNALGWVLWDPAVVLAFATPYQIERYV